MEFIKRQRVGAWVTLGVALMTIAAIIVYCVSSTAAGYFRNTLSGAVVTFGGNPSSRCGRSCAARGGRNGGQVYKGRRGRHESGRNTAFDRVAVDVRIAESGRARLYFRLKRGRIGGSADARKSRLGAYGYRRIYSLRHNLASYARFDLLSDSAQAEQRRTNLI